MRLLLCAVVIVSTAEAAGAPLPAHMECTPLGDAVSLEYPTAGGGYNGSTVACWRHNCSSAWLTLRFTMFDVRAGDTVNLRSTHDQVEAAGGTVPPTETLKCDGFFMILFESHSNTHNGSFDVVWAPAPPPPPATNCTSVDGFGLAYPEQGLYSPHQHRCWRLMCPSQFHHDTVVFYKISLGAGDYVEIRSTYGLLAHVTDVYDGQVLEVDLVCEDYLFVTFSSNGDAHGGGFALVMKEPTPMPGTPAPDACTAVAGRTLQYAGDFGKHEHRCWRLDCLAGMVLTFHQLGPVRIISDVPGIAPVNVTFLSDTTYTVGCTAHLIIAYNSIQIGAGFTLSWTGAEFSKVTPAPPPDYRICGPEETTVVYNDTPSISHTETEDLVTTLPFTRCWVMRVEGSVLLHFSSIRVGGEDYIDVYGDSGILMTLRGNGAREKRITGHEYVMVSFATGVRRAKGKGFDLQWTADFTAAPVTPPFDLSPDACEDIPHGTLFHPPSPDDTYSNNERRCWAFPCYTSAGTHTSILRLALHSTDSLMVFTSAWGLEANLSGAWDVDATPLDLYPLCVGGVFYVVFVSDAEGTGHGFALRSSGLYGTLAPEVRDLGPGSDPFAGPTVKGVILVCSVLTVALLCGVCVWVVPKPKREEEGVHEALKAGTEVPRSEGGEVAPEVSVIDRGSAEGEEMAEMVPERVVADTSCKVVSV